MPQITGHYIIKCARCGDVIAQCRCPDMNKRVTYGLCDKCSPTPKNKITEGKDPFEPHWSQIVVVLRDLYKTSPPSYDNVPLWENLVFVVKSELSWIQQILQKELVRLQPTTPRPWAEGKPV